ncbi:peptide deformylase [Pontibaca salina]|uniref:Peptide deformylase-like n=1 Tax=Pontibaca salina TaxID=2795731 RepID=A0A934HNH8_9RHOB|nr:peptide deformylase [Pontibaca salina]MBI6628847.1 peptide deformylase [Pontibaca salina]
MAVQPILRWPDRRLRVPAGEVATVDSEVRAIWDDMVDTMEAMPGVGLAAPQIGVGLRLAVVATSPARGGAVRLANPEILHASVKLREHEEASPCLPGVSAVIERPRAVTVRYLDESGAPTERDFVEIEATSVQHQIDHLAGRMYFDRLSKVKRDMLLRRARKLS